MSQRIDRSAVVSRLRRGVCRLGPLGLSALVLVVAVAAVAAWRVGRQPAAGGGAGSSVTRVGVEPGGSIPAYTDAARARLGALSDVGDSYALVSLRDYRDPAGLVPVFAGVETAAVYARVPLAGQQPQIVRIPANRLPQDVTAGMDEVARRKDHEAAGYADDSVGRSLRELARAEATAYRQHCPCVYAAVVRGSRATLATLAQRDAVRVVDPAPDVTRLDRAVWLPPLPEQSDQARPPGTASPTYGSR
jgi:hypothetical protein